MYNFDNFEVIKARSKKKVEDYEKKWEAEP